MAAWTELRRSTRRRYCQWCERPILVGEQFWRSACTPNHDGHGNERWWVLTHCLTCATRYGYAEPAAAMTGGSV